MKPADLPAVAFIGGGNMAQALAAGLLAQGFPAARLRLAEIDPQVRAHLARRLPGAHLTDEPAAAVAGAGLAVLAVLAVKPQQAASALAGVRLSHDTTLLSIAAGLRVATLRGWLGDHAAVVRCMPNTPALVGAGASALFADTRVDPAARERAETLLAAVGTVCWVEDESLLDVVTAVSGSGPAYFFRLAEALSAAGRRAGLPADVTEQLARQTLVGAGALVAADAAALAALRARVTSPGGTTAAALAQMDRDGFDTAVDALVSAALARARELGDAPAR
ncbi:MAG: pyrroline-5-carboxylate reductase [Gammaproteobacteria bacterium]|nr:pyrroline-5-carboxylate reductase [Gammaproteobacteria bacterium]